MQATTDSGQKARTGTGIIVVSVAAAIIGLLLAVYTLFQQQDLEERLAEAVTQRDQAQLNLLASETERDGAIDAENEAQAQRDAAQAEAQSAQAAEQQAIAARDAALAALNATQEALVAAETAAQAAREAQQQALVERDTALHEVEGLSQAASVAAQAREHVVSFSSEIWIETDASLTVQETIVVEARGEEIVRGIFRDFSNDIAAPPSSGTTLALEILAVRRNGEEENHFTRQHSDGLRLYMGDPEILLPPGRHIYEVRYTTYGQVEDRGARDGFTWNVTGNGWSFDIGHATARVHLPEGGTFSENSAITGSWGEVGSDFAQGAHADNDVWFQTTRTLEAGEGLTFSVSWPRGVVVLPSAEVE